MLTVFNGFRLDREKPTANGPEYDVMLGARKIGTYSNPGKSQATRVFRPDEWISEERFDHAIRTKCVRLYGTSGNLDILDILEILRIFLEVEKVFQKAGKASINIMRNGKFLVSATRLANQKMEAMSVYRKDFLSEEDFILTPLSISPAPEEMEKM